ncbi:MAG: FGGY-family carbohydrate kinase [Eubacterium sp.]|nr:FGGY-family carbohydrate kinase [Eubacterium sp.]
MNERNIVESGKTALGIELGSTRIKAVLSDYEGHVLASGAYDWENQLIGGIWTYALEDVLEGMKCCYSALRADVAERYGIRLCTVGVIGISAMMHGYIATDADGNQLAPFQTWRNTNTLDAAARLTELFSYNIPDRWSVAHLYQRILDGEEHVRSIASVDTLSAWVHRLLTGKHVLGVGDASGMFPIDTEKKDYNERMVQQFTELIAGYNYPWNLREIFPKVLTAGEDAGCLTEEGAALLDPTGTLKPGIPFCPPEGDAGTGMVATNAVAPRTGNLSAGTSIFAMIVLEKQLSRVYREIDMVTTPSGFPVAMSHANNGTSDINAWVELFRSFAELTGHPVEAGKAFELLYKHSLEGDPDCGGLLAYGYLSGEGITHLEEGRPLFVRRPDSRFTLANFMKTHLYTSFGAVRMGLDLLMKEEGVQIDRLLGHGGMFKTPGAAQRYLSAAVGAPVTVMNTAGEGGAWGIALLAAYRMCREPEETLEAFLENRIFQDMSGSTLLADEQEQAGFEKFMENYKNGIAVERTAVDLLW